ncbi:Telomerase Cajal body protein 1, partial [Kappamyces sp. JEL0680]
MLPKSQVLLQVLPDPFDFALYSPLDDAVSAGIQNATLHLGTRSQDAEPPSWTQWNAGARIWDACFYPYLARNQPASHAILVSSKDHPIRLIDTNALDTRQTYKTSHITTQEAATPLSLAFSLDASLIYAGFDSYVQVFDISGPLLDTIPLKKTRKSKGGQSGLISCIAANPDYSGIMAMGSFKGSVGLYDSRTLDCFDVLSDPSLDRGVVDVGFSGNGTYLVARARCSSRMQVWDVRSSRDVCLELDIGHDTMQRLYFDTKDQLVMAGDETGTIKVFDLEQNGLAIRQFSVAGLSKSSASSCRFHPTL